MADFTALKTAIQNAIKQNGNEEITGAILQEVMLAVVSTLGDSAINDLVTALSTEVTNRQNADGTLQSNINAEQSARQLGDSTLQSGINNERDLRIAADSTLQSGINNERDLRIAADNTLQNAINAINIKLAEGYLYVGIATTSTNPSTPSGKVFYMAVAAGTYTNFLNSSSQPLVLTQGINILKFNGTSWSVEQVWGVDDTPTPSSNNLVKSGGVFNDIMTNGSAFDLTAYNNGTTYADLNAALTALNALPADYKKGGMSLKYVQTYDNKYIQVRCIAQNFTTDITQWQGVDDEPTAGSNNLVKSGGVYGAITNAVNSEKQRAELAEQNLQGNIDVIKEETLEENRQMVNSIMENYAPVEIIGNVNNAADEEDLTFVNTEGTDVLKFKDKVHNPLVYSGLGRKVLRKNIVNGVNTLTQEMVSDTDTIYIIQYDFNLGGQTITVPANCVLEFEGGSLDNGVLLGNKTSIVAGSYKIFGDNLALFKYGYIKIQQGYIDNAMVPLEYIAENGVLNINKVQPNTQLFSQYNYTEKLVTDGYERASNENDNGVVTPIGESLDVRTDLAICPKQKVTFSNNKATVMFNSSAAMSLNGLQYINLTSSGGIFTVPATTHYLFYDGNGTLMHPGDTHADNDVYCAYISKLIPLVSQSTFVGKAKLSWFVGNAYVVHREDINNAPDATLQFQKAMLSSFDIESDIEGYIRIENSIYLETSKVVDFGGSYGWDSGVRQYNPTGNTHADINYSQKLIIYTLSTNKPLVYIRNSSIKLIGGKFTAEYSSNHTSEICVFDLDYPVSGICFDGTVFVGKTASNNSLDSTHGIKFLSRGQSGASGYCYGSKLNVSIYKCQYGISFNGSVNSIKINLWIDGFYKTLVGGASMCDINMIAQAESCLPKSLADGLLCDVSISGGTMDGFFWDLGLESQASDIIKPYGKGKISGYCQLIGKSSFQSFYQWIKTKTIRDIYTIDTASIPLSDYIWRNGCVSVSKYLTSNLNIRTSYGRVYKKTDGFQNNLQRTTTEAVRDYSIYYAYMLFDVNSIQTALPQIDDDEYLEMVFYPLSTEFFLSTERRLQYFTVVSGDAKNIQIIIDNSLKASLSTNSRPVDIKSDSFKNTKIKSIIVRVWNKTGSLLPHIFIWDSLNRVGTTGVGVNGNYAVYNNGNYNKYIDGTSVGEAAISSLNIDGDTNLTDKINSLNTLNSSPVLISQKLKGILWQYKNSTLFNLDGTGATLVHVGPTADTPNHTVDNKSLTKGTTYRDTDICKTIMWNGNKWIEEDGATPGVKRSGAFADKPAAADIYVGFKYFCTDKQTTEGATDGIEIIYKGNNVWVDALGRVVS